MVDLAESFNRIAADLQHAEILRNILMADVLHQLRTPLSVLESNLRAMLDHIYSLDDSEVANLYSQTQHLIRLVNDLRELSLAEAGRLPLEKTPSNLTTLIAETLQAVEPLVDPFRVRQVLFNLLSNGLRHTPQGGSITLRTVADAHISVSVSVWTAVKESLCV